ncbi:MAG TPA: AMP-binding protein, partial [Massilibacterium sp.]|nr:AMP-binding protein [Massilibacterium sp.]
MEERVARRWLKHYPSEIPHQIDYDEKPLFEYLTEAYLDAPNKEALYFLGKKMTYKELYEEVVTFSSRLVELGLEKGDRVSIMLPNCPQAVISYYGVLMAGGVVVQTNPMYIERELEFQLHDSKSKMIIVLDLLFPKVAKVKENSSLQKVIVTKLEDYLPFPKNWLYPIIEKKKQPIHVQIEYMNDVLSFKTLLKDKIKEPPTVSIDSKEDVALLQYTGGTTGLPKGVMLTHFNLVANTMQCQAWVYKAKKGEERVLAVLPFFHVYGMTVSMNFSIMYQSLLIILPRFELEEVLKTIEKQKPTLFPGAPTMYISLLNHPKIQNYDLSSINACISGSAPLPVEIQEQFEALTKGRLVEGYGLTEASPVTHANLVWEKRVKGSIGIPWPDTDALILKIGRDEPADLNEIGELVVKGPQVMKGYFEKPDETKLTLRNGYLYTGD